MTNIELEHGALSYTYELQLNSQGFTLGEDAELFQELAKGLSMNHIHGILTDLQYRTALQNLEKKIIKSLKVLKKEGADGEQISQRSFSTAES